MTPEKLQLTIVLNALDSLLAAQTAMFDTCKELLNSGDRRTIEAYEALAEATEHIERLRDIL